MTVHEERKVMTGVKIENKVDLTPLARSILQRRYLCRKANGVKETHEEMFWRVAKNVAQAEEQYGCDANDWAEKFYQIMIEPRFLPNSPCLMNAGTQLGQLAACFVLPVEDSLEGIFNTVKEAALVNKSGGGTGFSFSRLRPDGDIVGSTSGVASGPVSFMRVFDAATEQVKQGGRRRGANMGVLEVTHPDVLTFIRAKNKAGILENFNLSVAVDSEFMRKALAGEDYELVNPRTGRVTGSLNARDVLDEIIREAWQTGEPGLLFLDKVNDANPTLHIGKIGATNPCGEQPLLPYESCNLGSMNLTRMIRDKRIDWGKLRETTRLAVRFLDDVIDVNRYPLPQIEYMTAGNRKIGLGVMGFADLMYELGIPYDSEEAVQFAGKLASFIQQEAHRASEELAGERGCFPNWKGSTWDTKHHRRMRNAASITIAPTGSISLIAGCSSGIEPNFSLVYERKVEDERTIIVDPAFERIARKQGFYRPGLTEEILNCGSLKNVDGIPEQVKRVFVTALEIQPEWHVRMQAAFQQFTDNAVSKTVNLPKRASIADVDRVFRLAWELGCKGITVYRDGSRPDQTLRTHADVPAGGLPRARPEATTGRTKKVKVGCGNLYITVNRDAHGVCEIFTNVGRGGGCPSQAEATSRLASIALRAGVVAEAIVEQLRGIRCLSTLTAKKKQSGIKVLSCPDAIGRTIEEFLNGRESSSETPLPDRCPECGSRLEHEGGRCTICRVCGFSKCY